MFVLSILVIRTFVFREKKLYAKVVKFLEILNTNPLKNAKKKFFAVCGIDPILHLFWFCFLEKCGHLCGEIKPDD